MSTTQPPLRLLEVAAHRQVEASFAAAFPGESLMTRAADAALEVCRELCGNGGRVIVLAGPGNNGGDAWVLARLLHQAWFKVTLIAKDPPRAPEARAAEAALLASGVRPQASWPDGKADLIVDGLFGIGLKRAPDEWSAAHILRANGSGTPILALDVPSGLEADSGVAHVPCIQAHRTVSFIAGKPGLHTGEGPDCAGIVDVADLGTGEWGLSHPAGELLSSTHPMTRLPSRKRNTHKGSYGTVGILGGAPGMAGAGILSARAALRSGCGKVMLGLIEESVAWDPLYPEVMFRKARDLARMDGLKALVIGPGLGQQDASRSLLTDVLKRDVPVVLDADALNLISNGRALQTLVRRRSAPTLLTPHPSEAARMLHCETEAVNQHRVDAARQLARELDCTVVLKGAGSVVCGTCGGWYINSSGNPGMATGGMGDVLSGILGALLGQGFEVLAAACAGTWLHGAAADWCVATGLGPAGLLASDVVAAIPQAASAQRAAGPLRPHPV